MSGYKEAPNFFHALVSHSPSCLVQFLVVVVVLVGWSMEGAAASDVHFSSCPNLCSGHGECQDNAVCACNEGFRGNDCSQRECPMFRAWVDRPESDFNQDGVRSGGTLDEDGQTEAFPTTTTSSSTTVPPRAGEGHFWRECAGIGRCDRATGLCLCPAGFSGHACQRARCPDDCNGNGVCRTVAAITEQGLLYKSKDRNGAGDMDTSGVADDILDVREYDIWDGEMTTACVCDAGWDGITCEKKLCPRGRDAVAEIERYCGSSGDGCVDEVQSFGLTAAGETTFRLSIEYPLGFPRHTILSLSTEALTGYTPEENALLLQHAIQTTDVDGTFSQVTVSGSGSLGATQTFAITFTNVGADLPLHTITVLTGPGGVATAPSTITDGTKADAECSRRGNCDYTTGTCICEDGWTGPACRHSTRPEHNTL